ncbi:MAG: tRNA pseudouridine(38-40) synthase TruA [Acidobacteria bacterium]|nr:tRNA pseudouridine(38-40) synthase TruA [Acidobacteriota bacterium]
MNYRITLAYDGTEYCGWQIQVGQPTIQSVLNTALEKLEGAPVTTYAAGRTDAGVHAEGQVVSFRLTKEWNGVSLRNALNGNLPPDIRVLDATIAAENFHARFDAKGKTYRYRVFAAEVMNPLWARYAWHYPYRLDLEKLIADAQEFLGTHDFTAFTVVGCEAKTHVRTVTNVQIERDEEMLTLYFSGDGFLRYQVRTMVAALVEVNRGRQPKCPKALSIAKLIESRDRALIGAPAPAQGLTLLKVEY